MSAPIDEILRQTLARQVMDACLAMGFARAGVAPAKPTAWREYMLQWLRDGKHGDMGYMGELVDQRLDVTRLLPGARSVIVVADQYALRGHVETESESDEPMGVLARYARGRDYHVEIKNRLHELADRLRALFPGEEFRTFVDTGPAMEREHAVRGGLGFVGKHTLVIAPGVGSWLLLGGMATTLDIADAGGSAQSELAHIGCGTCTRCIDACPTQAIKPYEVEARHCVSYLTLEHQGEIDASLHAGIGDRLLGCDVCQEVCPFNAQGPGVAERGRVNSAYAEVGGRARLSILGVLSWTEEDRRNVLSGSAGKRASLAMLRRNAVIAAGNFGSENPAKRADIIDALRRVERDALQQDVVRNTAREVLRRLVDNSDQAKRDAVGR